MKNEANRQKWKFYRGSPELRTPIQLFLLSTTHQPSIQEFTCLSVHVQTWIQGPKMDLPVQCRIDIPTGTSIPLYDSLVLYDVFIESLIYFTSPILTRNGMGSTKLLTIGGRLGLVETKGRVKNASTLPMSSSTTLAKTV